MTLAVTNPTKEDFVESAMKKMMGSGGSEFVEGITSLIGRPLLNSVTGRDNFIIFSIFNVPDGLENKKVLGVFKFIFIEI
ncbi:hypothetical protein J2T13_003598 [Paenibacillus sp. DS2015]|uniref:hypothetical protein n=1 Tax=Paenibacillus sp. DS2015 TaxID=3373917 RepID=UPI003D1957FC